MRLGAINDAGATYQLDPDSPVSLPALRFMAALHRLTLEGRAPAFSFHVATPEAAVGFTP